MSVAAMAASGDSQPARREGCGRASSLIRTDRSGRRKIAPAFGARGDERAAHEQSDLAWISVGGRHGFGRASLRDAREPVADLEQFLEFFRYDEHRRAGV